MQLCSVGRRFDHEWLHELQFGFSEGRPGPRAHTRVGTQNQPVKSYNNVHAWLGGGEWGEKGYFGISSRVFVHPSSLGCAFYPQKAVCVDLGCFTQSCKWDSFCPGLLQVSPCVPQQRWHQGCDSCVTCCSSGSRYQPAPSLWPSGCWEKTTAAAKPLRPKLPAW